MKKNKKISAAVCCLSVLLALAPCTYRVGAAAQMPAGQGTGAGEAIPGAESEKTGTGGAEMIPGENLSGTTETGTRETGNTATGNTATGTTESGADNPVEEEGLWAEIAVSLRENLTPLLSAASLFVVAAVAVFAKRGLMPRLARAAASVLRSGQGLAEQVSRYEEEARKRLEALEQKMEVTLHSLPSPEAFREATDLIAGMRNSAEATGRNLADALMGQCRLLYDILMSADLPQYEKERIGEEYLRICRLYEGEEGHA